MKARKRAGTVGKVLGCALLLVIALFPIYWLVAMAIRPTSEMQGHISLIPQSLTIEHFISLFVSKGFGQAAINSLQTTLSSLVLSLIVGVCAAYILARRSCWSACCLRWPSPSPCTPCSARSAC